MSRESLNRANRNDILSSPLVFRRTLWDRVDESQAGNRPRTPLSRPRFVPLLRDMDNFNEIKSPIPRAKDRQQMTVSPFKDLENSPSLNISTRDAFPCPPAFADNNQRLVLPMDSRETGPYRGLDQQPLKVVASVPNLMTFVQFNPDSMTMQERIVSPRAERSGNRLCYRLKKLNIFSSSLRQEVHRPRASQPEPRPVLRPKRQSRMLGKTNRKRQCKGTPVADRRSHPRVFCFCKKSGCRKEYCICLKNNLSCNHRCRCHNCHNQRSSECKNSPKRHGVRAKQETGGQASGEGG